MDDIFLFLTVLAIAVVIFLVCRELVCWYSKINERINLLREQNELLREICDKLDDSKIS